jgi:ABC-type molybdate transport system ATPase subunit
MKNVDVKVTNGDNKLVITVDLDKQFGASGSGKSIIIATTEGNITAQDGDGKPFSIGLNVYRKA